MTLPKDSSYFLELQTQTGWGQMLDSFARWCAPEPGSRVLDVGTGPGLLPAIFSRQGAIAAGVDLDSTMFTDPLHPDLLVADAVTLPFQEASFNLVTASNLLFLTADPTRLLAEMGRVSTGQVCLLNPSEQMTLAAAADLADSRNLSGLARDTLLNYARRAETHSRWSEADLAELFFRAGLELTSSTLRMGTGLIRYACGQKIDV